MVSVTYAPRSHRGAQIMCLIYITQVLFSRFYSYVSIAARRGDALPRRSVTGAERAQVPADSLHANTGKHAKRLIICQHMEADQQADASEPWHIREER